MKTATSTTTTTPPPARAAGAKSPLTEPRVTTIAAVLDRLRAIQVHLDAHAPEKARDGVASFNHLYTVITSEVLSKVKKGTFFQDEEFIVALDVAFANRYFDALRAHELDPDTAPRSWAALIEHRSDRGILPMQFAVAGVNAHVNFDLAFAVVDTCVQLDRSLDYPTHRGDYDRINAIFAIEMERLREHFESRLGRLIDEYLIPYVDNLLGRWSVEAARFAAWLKAEVLWAIRDDPQETEKHRILLDKQTGLVGQTLLIEVVPLATLFRLEETFERFFDLFVFGPVGLASLVRRAIPGIRDRALADEGRRQAAAMLPRTAARSRSRARKG